MDQSIGCVRSNTQNCSGIDEDNAGVSDLAWAGERVLWSVQSISQRAVLIYKNVQELGRFRIWDKSKGNFLAQLKDAAGNVVDVIEFTEEDIFQQSDRLFYYDIPGLTDNLKGLRDKRKELFSSVGDLAVTILGDIDGVSTALGNRRGKYITLSSASAGDSVIEGSSAPEVARHLVARDQANQNLALSDERSYDYENQELRMQLVISDAADDSSGQTPSRQVQTTLVNTRNGLVLRVKQHELQRDKVRVNSHLLLARASHLNQRVVDKLAQVNLMGRMSDSLIAMKNRGEVPATGYLSPSAGGW